MNAIESIPGIGPYLPYLTAAVTLCSVIGMFLPPPKATTGAYAAAYHLVNWIALSFGNARNVAAPGVPSTSVTVAATSAASK